MLDNSFNFQNYRVIVANSFDATLGSLGPSLPAEIRRGISSIVETFCASIRLVAKDSVDFRFLFVEIRAYILGRISVMPSVVQTPDFLELFDASVTFSCTVTPSISCLNLVVDVLPSYLVSEDVARHSNFIHSELNLCSIQ